MEETISLSKNGDSESISNSSVGKETEATEVELSANPPVEANEDGENLSIPLVEGFDEEKPIDDDEFNIPHLEFEPSLESILNDVETSSLSDEGELFGSAIGNGLALNPNLLSGEDGEYLGTIAEGSDTVSIISKESSSDNRSRTSSRSAKHRYYKEKKKPASILRHVLLKGMTSQINSAGDKVNAGTATTITIGYLIVAIGTSHGYVLVFDVSQVLRWCLGETQHRDQGGAVSSLAISVSGTRLLVGYSKGLILMYDLENGKLLRTIPDCHAAATAVLLLRFTDFPTLALCSDSGGSVFELNFKRTMGIRGCDSRCIFSGSRGEVCTFEPLLLSGFGDNPLTKFVIVGLATLSKIIVVMIRPKLKVLFTQSLASDPATLPLIAWQMVIIQTTSNQKIVDPVLSFGRHDTISFYQATCDTKNSVQFLPLRKISVSYSLLSFHWLNPRTLVLLDTKEKLHVMDVRSQEELENIDLTSARLVYSSSHFKGLATGGNVSKAFAIAGERACYNSIICVNNQIVILGTKSVHALTMRLWHERLDYLTKQHHYPEALQLGYELYLEKAKAIIGLKGSKDSKKLIVREKTLYILDRYVDRIPGLNYLDDMNTAKSNYSEIISTCVNYHVLFDYKEAIFANLYDYCAANPFSKAAYLESLEPFILNDQLRAIPPTIVKEFITHYEEIENYKAVEACIVHLNVDTLDIHQTMKLCWTHGLYDAIIYIFNQGMNDYVTPLEELTTELKNAIIAENQLTRAQVILGNKILVYTSCCLAGRAYPYGNIPVHLAEKVQADVFQCITTLHSRNPSENEESYPYLRTFVKFDTREFFNVLSLSFEELTFQTELGKRQKQRLVDILLQIMVEHGNFTPTQVGILFTFLARQMARPQNSLFVSNLLFEQVLEHLTTANESARIDERQQALLELLQAGGLQHLDNQKLLSRCRAAKFFRVCEMLYEKTQEYDKILECYLLDVSRKHQIFSFLHKIFCNIPSQKLLLMKNVKMHLPDLVGVDHRKAAEVINLHFGEHTPDFVKVLENDSEKQYLFLKGLFGSREDGQNTNADIFLTEKYINLMCIHNNEGVCSFLKDTSSYRMEQTLEICKKHNLIEATCYLLEKDGKIFEAFDIILNSFQNTMDKVSNEIQSNEQPRLNTSNISSWSQLQTIFVILIQFSQRNSPKLNIESREKLWLPVLQLLIASYNKFQDQSLISSAFNEMNKHLLSSMMSHVSLQTVVEIVMNNPSYKTATFAEIHDIVLGMLEACYYEETMVTLVKKISESDIHDKLKNKHRIVRRGFTTLNKICPYCRLPLSEAILGDSAVNADNVVVFQCGHSFHLFCSNNFGIIGCPRCNPKTSSEAAVELKKNNISFGVQNPQNSCDAEEGNWNVAKEVTSGGFELKLEVPLKISPKEF